MGVEEAVGVEAVVPVGGELGVGIAELRFWRGVSMVLRGRGAGHTDFGVAIFGKAKESEAGCSHAGVGKQGDGIEGAAEK